MTQEVIGMDASSPPPAARTERTSKAMALSEAVALVPSGAFVALGGLWFHNNPSAAVHELIRQGVEGLTIVAAPPSSYAVDLLIGAGAVRTAYLAHVSFDHLGMAPNFRRAGESGEVEIIDGDEALLLGGLMATLEALPKHPVHSLKGTDLLRRSPLAGLSDAFGGADVAAPAAMAPDVCLLHAQEADVYGNVRYEGTPFCDPLLAKASHKVIVCVDRLVDNEEIRRDPHRTVIPGYLVDAVVETPYGAHPCASQGHYAHDEERLTAYMAAGRTAAGWRSDYLEPYVLRPRTPQEYLAVVGGAERIERLASVVS
ncbi:CoA transferase subunit A [Streptomyces sp. HGB0020]|uniref:CoA transferase subunit A n=1 Tax=Streptomyces sp. HGB0020 TaxID=1078086 RepID=UPI0018F8AE4C|nr:CoA transferase subunit A [Streptomyces sp. HGB0020]